MAQQVLVQLVDDLTGASSDDISTITFGLDGATYEIDLTDENADKLREQLAGYVEAARRVGGRLKRGTTPRPAGDSGPNAGQVREWAQENGFELSNRGRIPGNVLAAFQEAQTAAAEASKKPRSNGGRGRARAKKN